MGELIHIRCELRVRSQEVNSAWSCQRSKRRLGKGALRTSADSHLPCTACMPRRGFAALMATCEIPWQAGHQPASLRRAYVDDGGIAIGHGLPRSGRARYPDACDTSSARPAAFVLWPKNHCYHQLPFPLGVPILPSMSLLGILRHRQQRHASCVRWAMLLVLLAVAVAGMPRWVMHAHAASDASTLVVAMDGHNMDAHDTAAGDPADANVDGAHLHGHYIGALSSLPPSTFVGVLGDAPPAGSCPRGPVAPLCEGHLATLYRPPIV